MYLNFWSLSESIQVEPSLHIILKSLTVVVCLVIAPGCVWESLALEKLYAAGVLILNLWWIKPRATGLATACPESHYLLSKTHVTH